MLGSKIQGRKGLILYKTENGTSTTKNHCGGDQSNIWKVYVNEITLNTIESIWMKQFGLQRVPQAMFPLWKTLIEDILLSMVKHTLPQKKIPYINATTFVITIFDLWLSKGAFATFALVLIFLTTGTKICDTWFV